MSSRCAPTVQVGRDSTTGMWDNNTKAETMFDSFIQKYYAEPTAYEIDGLNGLQSWTEELEGMGIK